MEKKNPAQYKLTRSDVSTDKVMDYSNKLESKLCKHAWFFFKYFLCCLIYYTRTHARLTAMVFDNHYQSHTHHTLYKLGKSVNKHWVNTCVRF